MSPCSLLMPVLSALYTWQRLLLKDVLSAIFILAITQDTDCGFRITCDARHITELM